MSEQDNVSGVHKMTDAAQLREDLKAYEAIRNGPTLIGETVKKYITLLEAHGDGIQGLIEGRCWVAPNDMADDMQVAFAEKWYSKKRCIDDVQMDDCWQYMRKIGL